MTFKRIGDALLTLILITASFDRVGGLTLMHTLSPVPTQITGSNHSSKCKVNGRRVIVLAT